MSIALFKATLKKNWVLLLIFFGVLVMYATVMISMFNPDDTAELLSIATVLPVEFMNALGLSDIFTSLTSYLASWFYGFLMIAMPLVYSIILGNRLVAKSVDSGSMACLLSTPNSRVKITATKGIYAIVSIILLQLLLFGAIVVGTKMMLPGELEVGAFFKLNVTSMLVNMAVMSIVFFFSCLFNDSRYSMGLGAGVPIIFLLLNMLGGISSDTEILKKISIFGWYDPVELVNGVSALGVNLIYTGITVVLLVSGVLIFKHKRLPI